MLNKVPGVVLLLWVVKIMSAGLGTNGTSALFLVVIVGAVAWITVQDRRERRVPTDMEEARAA
jgi:uncharacterized membrane-anchored protein